MRARGNAGEDIAEADVLWRKVIGERLKERSAQELHVERGVVLVILDAVQFEQGEGNLVIDQLPVGGILDAE